MKRLHISLTVEDLEPSIQLYATLFAAEPKVRKPDYAKWILDDPRVNFAISTRCESRGIDHLGIEVEYCDELNEVRARLESAEAPLIEQGATACCYAQSEKTRVFDPDGTA